jgi:hypothetical protein
MGCHDLRCRVGRCSLVRMQRIVQLGLGPAAAQVADQGHRVDEATLLHAERGVSSLSLKLTFTSLPNTDPPLTASAAAASSPHACGPLMSFVMNHSTVAFREHRVGFNMISQQSRVQCRFVRTSANQVMAAQRKILKAPVGTPKRLQ